MLIKKLFIFFIIFSLFANTIFAEEITIKEYTTLTIASDALNSYRIGDEQEWGFSQQLTGSTYGATFKYYIVKAGQTSQLIYNEIFVGTVTNGDRRAVNVKVTLPTWFQENTQYSICGQFLDRDNNFNQISQLECKGFTTKSSTATTTLYCQENIGKTYCSNNRIVQVNNACLALVVEDCQSSLGNEAFCEETSSGAQCQTPTRVCFSEGCRGYDCRNNGCLDCYSCASNGECSQTCDPSDVCSKDSDCDGGICDVTDHRCKLCLPNEKYCHIESDGDEASRTCNSLGTGFIHYEVCVQACGAGECADVIGDCILGDSKCEGNVIQECESFGGVNKWVSVSNCADSGSECSIVNNLAACNFNGLYCCLTPTGNNWVTRTGEDTWAETCLFTYWNDPDKCGNVVSECTIDNDCPTSYICQNQKCIEVQAGITCSDGTKYDECSNTLPKYCDGSGELKNLASVCGCPYPTKVNGDGETCCTEGADCFLCKSGDKTIANCPDGSTRTTSVCKDNQWQYIDGKCGSNNVLSGFSFLIFLPIIFVLLGLLFAFFIPPKNIYIGGIFVIIGLIIAVVQFFI